MQETRYPQHYTLMASEQEWDSSGVQTMTGRCEGRSYRSYLSSSSFLPGTSFLLQFPNPSLLFMNCSLSCFAWTMETPTYEEWRADVAVEEPLLGEEKAPSENLARTMFQRTRRRGNVLFHMVLVLVYTSILIASWLYMRGHYSHGPGLTYGKYLASRNYTYEPHANVTERPRP